VARPAWKMAPDLSRPLVASSGNLDALDAVVTFRLLSDAAARALGDEGGRGRLREEIAAAAALVAPWWKGFGSEDPLDLGEALWLAHWYARGAPPRESRSPLESRSHAPAGSGGGGGGEGDEFDREFDLAAASDHIAARALQGLDALWEDGAFAAPARARLGFRELGAALGVQASARAGRRLPGWAGPAPAGAWAVLRGGPKGRPPACPAAQPPTSRPRPHLARNSPPATSPPTPTPRPSSPACRSCPAPAPGPPASPRCTATGAGPR
jgi:hypothetical protein